MSKFRIAYVHMGADKTGSTALQTFMDKNRQSNETEHAIFYAPEVWHARFASYFSGSSSTFIHNVHSGMDDETEISRLDTAYIASLEHWISSLVNPEILVFSYEGFHCLKSNDLSAMKNYLLQFAHCVRVIYYVRPPISYSLSSMSQHIKMGILVDEKPPVLPYKSLINNLRDVFGSDELVLKKFSKDALCNGDIVADFMHTIGSEYILPPRQSEKFAANESLSELACFVGNRVIEKYLTFDARKYKNSYELGKEIVPLLTRINGGRIKLTPKQLDYVLTVSHENTCFINELYGIKLDEDVRSLVYTAEEMRVINSKLFNDAIDQLRDQLVSVLNLGDLEEKKKMINFDTATFEDIESDKDIDCLRDEAVRLEKIDINKSFRLMRLANKARPNGPFIRTKVDEYRKILDKDSDALARGSNYDKTEHLQDSNACVLSDEERLEYYMAIPQNHVAKFETTTFCYDQVMPYRYGSYRGEETRNSYIEDLELIFSGIDPNVCIPVKIGDKLIEDSNIAFCKSRNIGSDNTILLKLETMRHWRYELSAVDMSWDNKLDEVIWRGATTGFEGDAENGRLSLVEKYFQIYNVGFSELVQGKGGWERFLKPRVGKSEQLKYKYIISAEGNDVATNLKWILSSNSVPLMTKPRREGWLMEGRLVPFVHYLPLSDDYSDLPDILSWARENDEKCEEIAKNGSIYMRQFVSKSNEINLQRLLVMTYQYLIQRHQLSVSAGVDS